MPYLPHVTVAIVHFDHIRHVSKLINVCIYGLIFSILFALFSVDAYGQTTDSTNNATGEMPYRVPKVSGTVTVDAILDEAIWKEAVKIDANIEVRPGENIPAPVKTEALIAYDNENLYVGIIAYDPDPSKIRATLSDRDNISGNDDWVLILFDTFNNGQQSYDFMCNPLGVQSDFIESNNGGGEWDIIWDSEGRITDEGYIVEMAIPFHSMRFPNGGEEHIWGFDVVRSYPRTVRHHIAAFPRDRNNNCYFCQLPKLIGFKGAKPGKNLEIDPTLSARYSQEREDETSGPFKEKDSALDPGVTLRWSVTSNLMLSTALNPDFSQVEADAAQMDINTKFPLYYSERRPFFTEGSEIFRSNFNLVHTRTLAEPDWGVKLTGKEGKHSLGYFTVRDNVTPLVFPGTEGADNTTLSMQSTGSVLRYKYDVTSGSHIGATFTDREGDEYHNRLASVDGSFRVTEKDYLGFQAIGSNTAYSKYISNEFDQPFSDFGGAAYRVNYNHNTENYRFYTHYIEADPDLRADLGFMTQAGYSYFEVGSEYMWRQGPGHWYTWLSIYGSYDLRRDNSGKFLHKVISNRINYQGPLQSWATIYVEYGKNRYEGKVYRANIMQYNGNIKPTGTTQINLNGWIGDQIDYDNSRAGKTVIISQTIDQKIGRHLTVNVNHRYQYLNVDPGRLYDANVSNLRFIYQFTRRMFVRLNLQHVNYDRNIENYLEENREDTDANTRKIFSQVLFSYKINPQTVFFLGYSDNYCNRNYTDDRGRFDDSLVQTNRAFFTKIGYAWLP